MGLTLENCIINGQFVLPVAGPLKERATQIPSFYWIALNDEELVEFAARTDELFLLVFGCPQRRAAHPVLDFMGQGRFDIGARGSQRIKGDVTTMRREWANKWNVRYGLNLTGHDHLASRQLDGQLLTFLIQCAGRVEIQIQELDRGAFPALETLLLTPSEGKKAVMLFLDELTAKIQKEGHRSFARSINAKPAVASLIMSDSDQGTQTTKKTTDEAAVAYLGRYLEKNGRSGLFGTRITVNDSKDAKSEPHTNLTSPASLKLAFKKWENRTLPKFPTEDETDVAKLAAAGIIINPDGTWVSDSKWIDHAVGEIVSAAGLQSIAEFSREDLRKRILAFAEKHLNHEPPQALSIVAVPDDAFGMRLGARNLAHYYSRVEDAARKSIAHQNSATVPPPLTPPDWDDIANHEPLTGLLFRGKSSERLSQQNSNLTMNNGWRGATSNLFVHGVIALEGAMRAYLKEAGFAYAPPEEMGAFWTQDVEATPIQWRLEILQEVYLAAWLWAWAQLLYAEWSPLNGPGLPRLRAMLGAWSDMFRSAWRLRDERNKSRPAFNPAEFTDILMWQLCRDWQFFAKPQETKPFVEYGGQAFFIPDQLHDAVLTSNIDTGTWGNGIKCFDKKRALSQFPRISKSTLLKAGHDEDALAFQLVGNLMLAGHSRFGSLLVGQKFATWVKENGLDPVGTRMFAQFGLLDTKSWLTGPSIAHMFDNFEYPTNLFYPYPIEQSRFTPQEICSEQRLREMWAKVTLAPLSYPLFMPKRNAGQTNLGLPANIKWPLHWMHRILECIARKSCLFSGKPLHFGSSHFTPTPKEVVVEWRRRSWGPLYIGGGLPEHPVRPNQTLNPDSGNGLLVPVVESLFRTWLTPSSR